MAMRVIGGFYRHRPLKCPENDPEIRPTKDRIREAFFSAMGDIEGKTFLDLYAGSGSMGIEAISRGVKKAYFVDNNHKSIKFVKDNIEYLKIENYELLIMDDLKALEYFKEQGISFDIIYLDPPYEKGKYEEVLSYIYNNKIIKNNGVVAFEANRKVAINPLWASKIKEYHYGDITVTTLRS